MVACVKPVYCLIVLLQIKIFQDVRKPEKLTEHAGLHYHLAAIVEAEHFINVYEDPTPGRKEQLYQKNITKKGQAFNLSFKYKWLAVHSWHIYSKELNGGLCKACVLFDSSTANKNFSRR